MTNTLRTVIVAVLAIVVGAVFALKQKEQPRERSANVTSPTQSMTASGPASLPRLVDLGATKCIPCKMMAPILEEMKEEFAGRLQVEFIDVWENRSAGEKYNISSIPTQIFYDSAGKELFRHEGFIPKEDILTKWKELGVDLAETAGSSGRS